MPQLPFVSTLRATSWLDLAGWAFAVFSITACATLLAPADARPLLRGAGLALPLMLLAAKDLAHAPEAWLRLRRAHARKAPWYARVTALLPPELVGIVTLDHQLWKGCLRRLRARPMPGAAVQGTALTYLERGAYGTARAVALVMLAVSLPLDTLIINLFVKDPDAQALIHTLRALAAIWTLGWLLGDRWHIGAGAHVMTDDVLHLAIGARSNCVVPLHAIARCERVDLAPRDWRRRAGVAQPDTLAVTPFDTPNCVLVLEEGAQVDVVHYGVQRRLPRYVLLYLDRPELLAARLRQRASA